MLVSQALGHVPAVRVLCPPAAPLDVTRVLQTVCGVHFTWGEIRAEGAERGVMQRLLCSGVPHDYWGLAFVFETISAFLMVLALRARVDSPAVASGPR